MNTLSAKPAASAAPTFSPLSAATGEWVTVCRVDDVPLLGARRVRRPLGADIAIFRTVDNRIYALLDRCPHKAGPLSQGLVFGQQVACPLHNWTIDLSTGCAAAPDVGSTPAFALQVVGDSVRLDAGEMAHLGVDLVLPMAGPCRRGDGVALWHARPITAMPSDYAEPVPAALRAGGAVGSAPCSAPFSPSASPAAPPSAPPAASPSASPAAD